MVNEVQERKSETNKDMNTGSKRQREREREWSVKKGESHRHTEKIKRAYYIKTMK